jgi:hypothetical protein
MPGFILGLLTGSGLIGVIRHEYLLCTSTRAAPTCCAGSGTSSSSTTRAPGEAAPVLGGEGRPRQPVSDGDGAQAGPPPPHRSGSGPARERCGSDPSASARFLSRAVAPVSGWSIIKALLQTAAGLPVTIEHWAVSTVRLAAW